MAQFTNTNTNASTSRGSTMSTNDSVTFKVFSSEHDQTRLFLIPRQCVTFPAVANRIAELFGFKADVPLQVQFKDDEDDLVTITTDEELRSALQLFADRPSIRLFVSKRKSGTTPSNPEPVLVKTEAVAVAHPSDEDSNSGSSTSEEEDTVPNAATSGQGAEGSVEHSKRGRGRRPPMSKEERAKIREDRAAKRAERIDASMGEGLKKLEELGFTRRKGLCVRLLKKHEGEVDKVAAEMKAIELAREQRRQCRKDQRAEKNCPIKEATIPQVDEQVPGCKKDKEAAFEERKQRRQEAKAAKNQLKEEKKQERELKKAELLEKRKLAKEARGPRQHRKSDGDDEPLVAEFKAQLEQLESMGFRCKRRNVKLLKRFEGDATKVGEFLTQKNSARTDARAERKKTYEEAKEDNKEALAKLAGMGYTNARRNLRLLDRNGGDVDKVYLELRAFEERRKDRAQRKALNNPAQVAVLVS